MQVNEKIMELLPGIGATLPRLSTDICREALRELNVQQSLAVMIPQWISEFT